MITDAELERIMAYADGELDAEEAAQVEAELASDPQAQALLQELRSTDVLLRQGLDAILDEPPPQRLLDALQGPAPRSAPVIPLRPRAPAKVPRQRRSLGWAAAAGVMLAIAVTTATLSLLGPAGLGPDAIVDNRLLQEALEQLPSGTPLVAETPDVSVMPLATYLDRDARPCRELELRAGTRLQHGLACRDAGGRWALQTLTEPEIAAAATAPGYVPASGASDPISAALDAIGAGASLTAAQEQESLRAAWQGRIP